MTGVLELNKKRMGLMLVIVGVAMILALAGAYGAFAVGAAWGLPVFVAALALGFGAQLWFIMGILKGRGS